MPGDIEPVNTLSYLTEEKSISPQLTFKWRIILTSLFLSFDATAAYNRR